MFGLPLLLVPYNNSRAMNSAHLGNKTALFSTSTSLLSNPDADDVEVDDPAVDSNSDIPDDSDAWDSGDETLVEPWNGLKVDRTRDIIKYCSTTQKVDEYFDTKLAAVRDTHRNDSNTAAADGQSARELSSWLDEKEYLEAEILGQIDDVLSDEKYPDDATSRYGPGKVESNRDEVGQSNPGTNAEASQSGETGPNNKRVREDSSDSENVTETKRPKLENYSVDKNTPSQEVANNSSDANIMKMANPVGELLRKMPTSTENVECKVEITGLDKDTRSPLDFVLDQQQEEPMAFFDDSDFGLNMEAVFALLNASFCLLAMLLELGYNSMSALVHLLIFFIGG